MKAIDIWTSGCYLVVFICMAEYCSILYLTKRSDWQIEVRNFAKAKAKLKSRAKADAIGDSKMFQMRKMPFMKYNHKGSNGILGSTTIDGEVLVYN